MRLLFVHNCLTSFVRLDLEGLREHFEVTECALTSRFAGMPGIWRQVADHDFVFVWFASWHAFLPLLWAKIQAKPSILVVGGYDVANMPDIGYGHQRGGLKKSLSRWCMGLASQLVTNSRYSGDEVRVHGGSSAGKLAVVYHGLADPFGEPAAEARARSVLTVGNVSRVNLRRKGLLSFVQSAALVPDAVFTVAGAWQDDAIGELRAMAPANVRFTGRLSDEDLLREYRNAAVYVQVSLHEGFGMSLAESMLAGCIPVTTRAGALPEVAGDAGVYCESQDPARVAEAVLLALSLPATSRLAARRRILERFPAQARRRALREMICGLGNPERMPAGY